MKKGIHPEFKKFKINFSNGEVFETETGGHANEMLMEVDFRKLPAWSKESGNVVNESNKNVSNFKRKYEGLSILFGKKS